MVKEQKECLWDENIGIKIDEKKEEGKRELTVSSQKYNYEYLSVRATST